MLSFCCPGSQCPCPYPWCLVSVLQDLVVEVVYPRCAICRQSDRVVYRAKNLMAGLRSGEAYRKEAEEMLIIAGSQAEGLAIEEDWGHPFADNDIMMLYGGKLGVYMPGSHTPRGAACLEYHPEGCPPAYCKLEATNLAALRQELHDCAYALHPENSNVSRCISLVGGRNWLDTYHTVRLTRGTVGDVSGPAAQLGQGFIDMISTLVCSDPHPALMREFLHRSRQQWPPSHVIEDIIQLPMLLVLTGHKLSKDCNREARISWSHCEMKIMQELSESVRQGYIACKYVLKHFLTVHRRQTETGDGRSRVGSFHIKTVFLHYLEKRPPWMIMSPFRLFVDLLNELVHYLEVWKLPHYFLSECNLLETVDGEERRIARQTIQAILSDPLAAILTSPTNPHQIYGDVLPGTLVNSVHRVMTHATCERSRKDLSMLLARVDGHRYELYRRQRERDEAYRVSGRPCLTGLCDTLKQI